LPHLDINVNIVRVFPLSHDGSAFVGSLVISQSRTGNASAKIISNPAWADYKSTVFLSDEMLQNLFVQIPHAIRYFKTLGKDSVSSAAINELNSRSCDTDRDRINRAHVVNIFDKLNASTSSGEISESLDVSESRYEKAHASHYQALEAENARPPIRIQLKKPSPAAPKRKINEEEYAELEPDAGSDQDESDDEVSMVLPVKAKPRQKKVVTPTTKKIRKTTPKKAKNQFLDDEAVEDTGDTEY